MPRIVLFTLAFVPLLLSTPAQGQRFELTPFYGYQLGGELEDRFDDDFDQTDIEEGDTAGIILGFGLADPSMQIELLYSTQDTEVVVPRFFGNDLIEVGIDYYQLGFLYQWLPHPSGVSHVRPFVVASIGATSFDLPRDRETRFSWTIGGGAKLMFNDHLGLRFEGRFNSTLIDTDDEVFCNPDYCFSYTDDTFLWQFDFKGGLIFAF